MDYGEVLTRGWQIIWKHKILWIFGILAGCGGGSNSFRSGSRYSMNGQSPFDRWFSGISNEQWALIIAVFVVVMCILAIVVAFLSTMGRIGLIRGSSQADQGMDTHLTFGDLFHDGMRYFWRIFLLNLIFAVLAILVFGGIALLTAAGGVGIAAAGNANNGPAAAIGAGVLLLILCLCCVLIPISIFVNALLEMVYRAIVVEDMSIGAGIARGWEIIKNNLGSFVLIWVILLVVGLVGGFIIAAPLVLFALPGLASSMAGRNAMQAGFVMTMICFIAYLPILLVLQGIITSYTQSTWTVAYRRFIGLQAGGTPGGNLPVSGGAAVFDANPPETTG